MAADENHGCDANEGATLDQRKARSKLPPAQVCNRVAKPEVNRSALIRAITCFGVNWSALPKISGTATVPAYITSTCCRPNRTTAEAPQPRRWHQQRLPYLQTRAPGWRARAYLRVGGSCHWRLRNSVDEGVECPAPPPPRPPPSSSPPHLASPPLTEDPDGQFLVVLQCGLI